MLIPAQAHVICGVIGYDDLKHCSALGLLVISGGGWTSFPLQAVKGPKSPMLLGCKCLLAKLWISWFTAQVAVTKTFNSQVLQLHGKSMQIAVVV